MDTLFILRKYPDGTLLVGDNWGETSFMTQAEYDQRLENIKKRQAMTEQEFVLKVVSDHIRDISNEIDEDEVITEDELLCDDLGLDSLDVVELAIVCEKSFNISIPDELVDEMETVKDLVDYIVENTVK